MHKITSIFLVAMVFLLAHGSARPAFSSKTHGTKLTPSVTLVFQSLHNAIDVSEQKEDKAAKHRTTESAIVVKASPMAASKPLASKPLASPIQQTHKDWAVIHPSGLFGDAESGRLPSIMLPVPVI